MLCPGPRDMEAVRVTAFSSCSNSPSLQAASPSALRKHLTSRNEGKSAAEESGLPSCPRQLDVLCVKVWLGKGGPSSARLGGEDPPGEFRRKVKGQVAGDLQAEWCGRCSPPPPRAGCIRVSPHPHSTRQPRTYSHMPGAEGLQPDSLATAGRVALCFCSLGTGARPFQTIIPPCTRACRAELLTAERCESHVAGRRAFLPLSPAA